MTKQFLAFAKRALAFTLALVLMLSLAPTVTLPVDAAVQTDGWEYNTKYMEKFKMAEFSSNDSDLIFIDNQAYDWKVYFWQTFGSITPTITATITDSTGTIIDTFETADLTLSTRQKSTVLQASNFSKLTRDLFGTFTVTMEMYNGNTFMARMTKTFSRVRAAEATVTSRSNPDKVFTFADPIDLVLNIKKNDGIATAYNAAVTVTKGSTELLAKRGFSLPESTNITLNVKDLVNLPAITTAGTYNVNLTLTDSQGNTALQKSFPFCVVALTGSVTATFTSETSANFVFDECLLDLKVNLAKTDGVAESLVTAVTVKNSSDSLVYSKTFETIDTSATFTPDLSDLPATGIFTITAVVTDDAGNQRATASLQFKNALMTGTITNLSPSKTGNIYKDSDSIRFKLAINHTASANKTVKVKAVGTLNSEPFEHQIETTVSSNGTATVQFPNSLFTTYGVYEDISIKVYSASGSLMWQSGKIDSFSRILATATPGSLPILNVNDHFTSGNGDLPTKVALSAQLGANMWRGSIPWVSVEKKPSDYSMPKDVKAVMDATKKNGMQALILLAYNNDNKYPDGTKFYGEPNPTNSTWLTAYANYCHFVAESMAQNYPNQVVGFEIWNEWNHATMSKVPAEYRTGAHYATVVIAASEQIRAVNAKYGTKFKVIAGATAGDGYLEYDTEVTNSNTFIKAMLATDGFVDAVDGISFHTYASEETTPDGSATRYFEYISPKEHDFTARIDNFKKLMTQYGAGDKEMWLTEVGWTTNSEPSYSTGTTDGGKTHITYGVSEKDAAAYLVQMYALGLGGGKLTRIFWYDLMNDISNQTGIWANNQTESNYGLIHSHANTGDQPVKYSAKQGYVTMCAMSSMLAGAKNGQEFQLGTGVEAYSFTVGSKTVVVAWTTSDTTKTLSCSGTMTVTDMYGNTTSNLTTATLSECPIYITYSGTLSVG